MFTQGHQLAWEEMKQKSEKCFMRLAATYKREITEGGKENIEKKRKHDKERIYQKRQAQRSVRGVLTSTTST